MTDTKGNIAVLPKDLTTGKDAPRTDRVRGVAKKAMVVEILDGHI
jgi:hypothetical protein